MIVINTHIQHSLSGVYFTMTTLFPDKSRTVLHSTLNDSYAHERAPVYEAAVRTRFTQCVVMQHVPPPH